MHTQEETNENKSGEMAKFDDVNLVGNRKLVNKICKSYFNPETQSVKQGMIPTAVTKAMERMDSK